MKVWATTTALSFLARVTMSMVTGNRDGEADRDDGHDDEHLGQREAGGGRPGGGGAGGAAGGGSCHAASM